MGGHPTVLQDSHLPDLRHGAEQRHCTEMSAGGCGLLSNHHKLMLPTWAAQRQLLLSRRRFYAPAAGRPKRWAGTSGIQLCIGQSKNMQANILRNPQMECVHLSLKNSGISGALPKCDMKTRSVPLSSSRILCHPTQCSTNPAADLHQEPPTAVSLTSGSCAPDFSREVEMEISFKGFVCLLEVLLEVPVFQGAPSTTSIHPLPAGGKGSRRGAQLEAHHNSSAQSR